MGCHALLQGIFLTQGWNAHLPHLLHWLVASLPVRTRDTHQSGVSPFQSEAEQSAAQSPEARWRDHSGRRFIQRAVFPEPTLARDPKFPSPKFPVALLGQAYVSLGHRLHWLAHQRSRPQAPGAGSGGAESKGGQWWLESPGELGREPSNKGIEDLPCAPHTLASPCPHPAWGLTQRPLRLPLHLTLPDLQPLFPDSPQARASGQGEGGVHSPSFLGERENVPLTTLQWELSPPHTPHLSSCLLEPITPSQPTFCRGMVEMRCLLRPCSPLGPGACSLGSPGMGSP